MIFLVKDIIRIINQRHTKQVAKSTKLRAIFKGSCEVSQETIQQVVKFIAYEKYHILTKGYPKKLHWNIPFSILQCFN